MISLVESVSECIMFKCAICQTRFDQATIAFQGTRFFTSLEGTRPIDSEFVTIHLTCPTCFEKKTYKIRLVQK